MVDILEPITLRTVGREVGRHAITATECKAKAMHKFIVTPKLTLEQLRVL